MAQDLGFDEILVIHDAVGAPPAPGVAVAERAAPAAAREGEETRVLLRFGDRVEIIPNHVCPTINLMDEMHIVRDGKIVDRWKIAARGKVR